MSANMRVSPLELSYAHNGQQTILNTAKAGAVELVTSCGVGASSGSGITAVQAANAHNSSTTAVAYGNSCNSKETISPVLSSHRTLQTSFSGAPSPVRSSTTHTVHPPAAGVGPRPPTPERWASDASLFAGGGMDTTLKVFTVLTSSKRWRRVSPGADPGNFGLPGCGVCQ